MMQLYITQQYSRMKRNSCNVSMGEQCNISDSKYSRVRNTCHVGVGEKCNTSHSNTVQCVKTDVFFIVVVFLSFSFFLFSFFIMS